MSSAGAVSSSSTARRIVMSGTERNGRVIWRKAAALSIHRVDAHFACRACARRGGQRMMRTELGC